MEQQLAHLLSTLPTEIRWQILKEVVGRQVIHISSFENAADVGMPAAMLPRRSAVDVEHASENCRTTSMETVSTVNSANLKRLLELAHGNITLLKDIDVLWPKSCPDEYNNTRFRFSTDCLRIDNTNGLASFCWGSRYTDVYNRNLTLQGKIALQLDSGLFPAANRPFHRNLKSLAVGTLENLNLGYIATFTGLKTLYFLIDSPTPVQQTCYPQKTSDARKKAHRKDFENHCIEWWKWLGHRLQITISIPQFLWPGMYDENFDRVSVVADTPGNDDMSEEISALPPTRLVALKIVGDKYKLARMPSYEIGKKYLSLDDYKHDGKDKLPAAASYGIGSYSNIPGYSELSGPANSSATANLKGLPFHNN